jgi:hypothetical protein
MAKSSHFSGQPLYGQVINLLDKSKILRFSRSHGGERYVKSSDGWFPLAVMLYAVIVRFNSSLVIILPRQYLNFNHLSQNCLSEYKVENLVLMNN